MAEVFLLTSKILLRRRYLSYHKTPRRLPVDDNTQFPDYLPVRSYEEHSGYWPIYMVSRPHVDKWRSSDAACMEICLLYVLDG